MTNKDIEELINLMNKKQQVEELSLEESIKLRRLAAEYVAECGELVSKKMAEFYHF